jgi:hypothetical protein
MTLRPIRPRSASNKTEQESGKGQVRFPSLCKIGTYPGLMTLLALTPVRSTARGTTPRHAKTAPLRCCRNPAETNGTAYKVRRGLEDSLDQEWPRLLQPVFQLLGEVRTSFRPSSLDTHAFGQCAPIQCRIVNVEHAPSIMAALIDADIAHLALEIFLATECGMDRVRSPETLRPLLKIHADLCATP